MTSPYLLQIKQKFVAMMLIVHLGWLTVRYSVTCVYAVGALAVSILPVPDPYFILDLFIVDNTKNITIPQGDLHWPNK